MDFTTHTKIIKINYEKLYYYEKEKRETIEKSLETKNIEIEKLKNLLELKNKELDEVNNIEESLSLININTNEDNNQDNNQDQTNENFCGACQGMDTKVCNAKILKDSY